MHSLQLVWQHVLQGGYLAVGTFFVLSGFVLGLSYASTEWNARSFVGYCAARYARVYPVYALSLLVLVPIIAADLQSANRPPEENAVLVANYGFVLQGWFGNPPVNWNTPAWSLSCELFFYLCFPLAALLIRNASWRRLLVICAVTLALPNLLTIWRVPQAWKPIYHFGDFLIGIAAARCYAVSLSRRWTGRGYWLYLPASVALFCLVGFPKIVPAWLNTNSAIRPFNALLLTGLALGGGLPVRALSTSAAAFLGRASYSMYILHIPVLWWFKRYFTGVWSNNVTALIYVTGVIAVSGVVSERVEEPANRKIRKWVTAWLSPLRPERAAPAADQAGALEPVSPQPEPATAYK